MRNKAIVYMLAFYALGALTTTVTAQDRARWSRTYEPYPYTVRTHKPCCAFYTKTYYTRTYPGYSYPGYYHRYRYVTPVTPMWETLWY